MFQGDSHTLKDPSGNGTPDPDTYVWCEHTWVRLQRDMMVMSHDDLPVCFAPAYAQPRGSATSAVGVCNTSATCTLYFFLVARTLASVGVKVICARLRMPSHDEAFTHKLISQFASPEFGLRAGTHGDQRGVVTF